MKSMKYCVDCKLIERRESKMLFGGTYYLEPNGGFSVLSECRHPAAGHNNTYVHDYNGVMPDETRTSKTHYQTVMMMRKGKCGR